MEPLADAATTHLQLCELTMMSSRSNAMEDGNDSGESEVVEE